MNPDFDIRYSELDDLAYLKAWFDVPGGCDPFPFGEGEKEEALTNWIGFSKFKASLTGLVKGEPCAIGTLFLMPYRKVAHLCSFYVIVDPALRRQGHGTQMVRNLAHLAKNRFRIESLYVEIFEGNPIQSILENLKFTQFATQDNYIHIHGPKARLLYDLPL